MAGGSWALLDRALRRDALGLRAHLFRATFIGVLPIAGPWALVAGTGMGSLSLLGIAYTVLFISGFYCFAARYTGAIRAALLCASMACFLEFFPAAATAWRIVSIRSATTTGSDCAPSIASCNTPAY